MRRLSDSTRSAALPKFQTQDKIVPSVKPAPVPTRSSVTSLSSSKDSSVPPAKRLASAVDSSVTQKEVVLNKRWTDGSVSWDSLPASLATLGKVTESTSFTNQRNYIFVLVTHLRIFHTS